MAIEISCINKIPRDDPHDHITHVGGVFPGGQRWRQTSEQTIREIDDREYSYCVNIDGEQVDVIVAERLGRKYLKTRADGDRPNNLLSLSECPIA